MSTETKPFHLGDILSTSIDPLDELRMMRPDAEIIAVVVPDEFPGATA